MRLPPANSFLICLLFFPIILHLHQTITEPKQTVLMKKMLFTLALMALPIFALKATAQETPTDTTVYRVVDKMPEYPGGVDKILKDIRTCTANYWDKVGPKVKDEYMRAESIYRRVVVSFVINENGQATDPVILRSVDKELDKEAIRIIKSMPRWIPGEQNGKKVKVKFTLPFTLHLQ